MKHNENRGKTSNSSEYFTNSQAPGSNDRTFSGTNMQRHHQDIQDFDLFFNFNRLVYLFQRVSVLQLVIKQQPTTNTHSSSAMVYIEG